jgi:hypothetical protein
VKLHSRVLPDKQRKYYNCGIGTRLPDGNKASWRQKIDNGLDQAFALLVILTSLVLTGDSIFSAISRTLSSRRTGGFARNINLETKYFFLVRFFHPLLNGIHLDAQVSPAAHTRFEHWQE